MNTESKPEAGYSKERKKKKKRKKIIIITVSIIAVLMLGMIAGGTVAIKDAKLMKQQAMQLKSDLKVSMDCIKAEKFDEAEAAIGRVDALIDELRLKLDQPMWKLASAFPVVGKDISSIDDLLALAGDASGTVIKPMVAQMKEYPLSELKVGDGFNVGLLISYVDFAEKLEPEIDKLASEIDKINISLDKKGKLNQYKEELLAMNARYHELKEYLPVFRTVLGGEEDRLYMLAAQNSSEIRAGGGFPGSIGTIRIQDGILTVGEFKTVYDVLPYSTPAEAGVTSEENALFGHWMSYPRDAEYNPDFGRVAYVWATAYESNNGEKLDGVISLTPSIIQKMLELHGEITLSDGTVLNGSNATKVLQYDLYGKYFAKNANGSQSNDIVDALFAETAKQTMNLFMSGFSIKSSNKYFSIFSEGVQDRTIMMWMADENEESVMIESGCSGILNTGENNAVAGVYYSGSDPCKLGWFFNLDTEVGEPVVNEDGTKTYDVKVVLSNVIDSETIANAGTYILGNYGGAMKGFLHLFAPTGGTISDFNASNGLQMTQTEYQGLQLGYSLNVMIYPDAPLEITYKVTTAAGVDDTLTISSTPTLQNYR